MKPSLPAGSILNITVHDLLCGRFIIYIKDPKKGSSVSGVDFETIPVQAGIFFLSRKSEGLIFMNFVFIDEAAVDILVPAFLHLLQGATFNTLFS